MLTYFCLSQHFSAKNKFIFQIYQLVCVLQKIKFQIFKINQIMRQKIIFSLLLFLLFSTGYAQESKITGSVFNADNQAVVGADVMLLGTNYYTQTDQNGNFVLDKIKPGNYQIFISSPGYEDYINEIVVKTGMSYDLGKIKLNVLNVEEDQTIVTLSQDEIAQEESGEENISGLLHGSRDVFLSAAAYNLGQLRFKIRGYDNRYTEIDINGVPMENLDNGRVYWSLWGGLNAVTRYKTSYLGLQKNDMTFGNLGGSTNIDMYPSKNREGYNVTYSLTNRSYRQRLMFTYSTGLMENNWALTFSGSRRWSNEGYQPGTFYDAWAYYVGAEKHIGKHQLVFNFFGAPIKRGKAGPTTQEVYDLMGDNFYNPYWGWQEGEKRNSRIANSHIPVFLFTDVFNLNKTTKITSTLMARAGRNGSTALNWYNAPDPRPDYYRYLPSYYQLPEVSEAIAEAFQNDPNYNQINWTRIYNVNYNSYDEIENADGIEGNTVTGRRAQYILEERRYDQRSIALSSVINKSIKDNIKVDGGVLVRYYKTKNFKVLDDLLGADYWVDIDKYAERDYVDLDSAQNDLQHPNHIIKEGDVFGYNYDANTVNSRIWTQGQISLRKFDIYGALALSYTGFWRYGYMQNGKFPENSLGKSKTNNFFNYAVKSGVTYKLTGRHYFVVRAAYMTQAPTFMNAYISPRTRDYTVDNLKSEKILSVDGGYFLRAPKIKASINAFYTQFNDQTKVRSFYHDGYRNYVNYVLTNLNTTHEGVEMAVDYKINSALSASAAASLGYYYYTSRPDVTITVDNSSEVLAQDKTVYIENYFVGGTPQTAATAGMRYRGKKYWFAGFNVNYVDNNYIQINPERRTEEAIAYVVPGSDQWHAILDQQKLNGGFTLDLFFSKSFKYKDYYMYLNISVNNVLNNTNIQTGGFEQYRFDLKTKDPNRFPPKYFYGYGRQYFINLSFRF